MTSTSVATVELVDNNDAQRVGKFMCVVPPKVRTTRAMSSLTSLASTFGRASSCAHDEARSALAPTDANDGRTRLPTRLTFSIFLALRLTACVVHVTRSRVSSPRVFSTDAPREPVRRGVPRRAEHRAGRRVVRFGVPDVVHERGRRRRRHKRGSRDPGVHGQRDHRLVLRASHERGLPRLAPVLGGGARRRPTDPPTRVAAGGCQNAGRRPVLRSGAGVSHVQNVRHEGFTQTPRTILLRVFRREVRARLRRARDPSGTYPLLYGRDESGAVVVANFESAERMFRVSDQHDASHHQAKESAQPLLKPVPAGCFIYGHRGVSPRRFAKDEASAKKLASVTSDAVADALRAGCASAAGRWTGASPWTRAGAGPWTAASRRRRPRRRTTRGRGGAAGSRACPGARRASTARSLRRSKRRARVWTRAPSRGARAICLCLRQKITARRSRTCPPRRARRWRAWTSTRRTTSSRKPRAAPRRSSRARRASTSARRQWR